MISLSCYKHRSHKHGSNRHWQNRLLKLFVVLALALSLTACLGTAVGVVVDTAIEVVKIPFKVGGAVIDVVRGDDDDKNNKDKDKDGK